jgi:hypothetical protein
MNKIIAYNPNHKCFEINSYNDGKECNVWIKIRLKHFEVHNCCNKNLLYLIFTFSIIQILLFVKWYYFVFLYYFLRNMKKLNIF